ncbi:MAG: PQQ-binding-like beta-propeller repeat protein, partial [Woeseia sp.]
FLPTTSPSPDFFGGKRPGNNRFANSVVALRATTGEVVWDFQLVHHDLWDYDLAAQPLLIDIERDGERIPAVVQATKMGHVFTLHRETGVPLFPVEERTVPGTTIAGEVTSATQPFPVQPPPLHDQRVTLWDYSADNMQLCSKLLEGIRYDGIFTPPSTSGTLLFPGNAGGTNWGSMAADPQQQLAVLAINRLPTVVELIPRAEFESRRKHRANDLVGKQYTAQIGTPYGMARFEMYNPQLGIPCLEGPWGELIALDMSQGKVKWRAPLGVWPGLSEHPEARHWGSLSMGGPLITAGGLVLIAPRFNKTLLAYELATGEIVWRGELPAMATATPMSYHLNGATYVVIAAGGDVVGDQSASDFVVAFKLADDNSIEIPRPLSDTEKIR